MPDVYRLLGGPGSPYSHKLRAALRYRRIPHLWIVPQGGFGGSGGLGDGTELEKAGKGMIPVLQYPDGGYRADSTPILYDLETRHADRSIVPSDPGHAFLAHLIEDMADEWLPLPMFYFRWTDDQRWCAERQMVGWIGAVGEDALASQAQAFMDRQKAQLEAAGLAAWPRETVLAQYDAVLDILERQLCESLFLFGSRPSLAEFGLYGQLTQYAVDPFVCNRMKERAVRVYQWVHLMDDASGIEGEWLAPDAELSAPVRDLLGLAGSLHLPILQRMLELGGGPRQTYKGHCLLWLRRELADLPADARDRIEPLLRDAACWDALQLAPGERDKVPPMLPV